MTFVASDKANQRTKRGWVAGTSLPKTVSAVSISVATIALSLSLGACGSTGRANQQLAHDGPKTSDHDDYDDATPSMPSQEIGDDREVEDYGHPASPTDRLALTSFAKRFIDAAAHEDGGVGCTLILPVLAAGVYYDYGRPHRMPYMHGDNCAQSMTGLFKHFHSQFAAEAAGLRVTAVRVNHNTAFVLLSFRGLGERRFMGVERVGHRWKLEALRDSPYP